MPKSSKRSSKQQLKSQALPRPDGVPPQAWGWAITDEPEFRPAKANPHLTDGGHWQGLPLGGIGAGGIGHNYRGAFGRWTVKAGSLKHFCDPANIFAIRQQPAGGAATSVVLHPGYPLAHPDAKPPAKRALASWNWDFGGAGCNYYALFPKAWRHYPASAADGRPVEMLCEQFSPIMPHNYQESSYPLGVYVWRLHNTSASAATVSILFSFTNMTGWFRGFGDARPRPVSGNVNRPFDGAPDAQGRRARGVVMTNAMHDGATREGFGQFCIAALESDRCRVSRRVAFDPQGDGRDVWAPFARDGALDNSNDSPICAPRQSIAGAICVTVTLAPGERAEAPMALVWDLPVIEFGSGREHLRRYTKFWGANGDNAAAMAEEALRRHGEWSAEIDRWHQDVISKQHGPDWYYAMLFNEAYLLVDGLTVWTDGPRESPGADPFFGVIECPDYPFYCTLDLWSYGSFVLLRHWPELEKNVIRRFAHFILSEDARLRQSRHGGPWYPSLAAGAAPHDFGHPEEDPPFTANSYTHRDTNRWKDLNCHFVLTAYRDATALKDDALARDVWPAVRAAIEYLEAFDKDGDGLIENDGTPDQTMDNIPMTGPSSYCGGLWLGALHAALRMAVAAGDRAFIDKWQARARSARDAFERALWTGDCYRVDTEGPYSSALYVDALFGIWLGRVCGLRELAPEAHLARHARTVYERNVAAFHGGRFGGCNLSGAVPRTSAEAVSKFNTTGCQVAEILSGLNMSFACQLLDAGMKDEAFALLRALYETIYERYGLWFRTPAAWTAPEGPGAAGTFRAILNLRPLAIWGVEEMFR